jgi:hypothetical protein
MPHAILTPSPSFSCGCLFYRSSVAPLDLHVEVIRMRIALLCATFPQYFKYEKIYCAMRSWARHESLLLGSLGEALSAGN